MQRFNFRRRGQTLYLCLGVMAMMMTGAMGLTNRMNLRAAQSRSHTNGLALLARTQEVAVGTLLDGSGEKTVGGIRDQDFTQQRLHTSHLNSTLTSAKVTTHQNQRAALHLLRITQEDFSFVIRDYKK